MDFMDFIKLSILAAHLHKFHAANTVYRKKCNTDRLTNTVYRLLHVVQKSRRCSRRAALNDATLARDDRNQAQQWT